jgi:hypothetical protein
VAYLQADSTLLHAVWARRFVVSDTLFRSEGTSDEAALRA